MSQATERSLKDKIKRIAKEQDRIFNDVWINLILERFLARLSHSNHREQLIFKGGMLLARYLEVGRETLDLDFLLTDLQAEEESLKEVISEITAMDLNDGFAFDSIEMEEVRHIQTHYPGFNVSLIAHCGQTKTPFSLDVGIGDIVHVQELVIPLSKTNKGALFEKDISLKVYPIESIFAEKYETACFRGASNSRMKDYHDLWMMIRDSSALDIAVLQDAIKQTFSHRKTLLELIPFYSGDDADRLQNHWTRHLRSLGDTEVKDLLPESFETVVQDINSWLKEHIDLR